MPEPDATPGATSDWTGHAPKWAGVIVLSVATLAVAIYAGFWRVPRVTLESAPAAGGAGAPGATGGTGRREAIARRLDINTADATALEQLPGVGAGLALAIVRDREQNGRFRDVDDLDRVPGIGPVTLKGLRDYVRVGE